MTNDDILKLEDKVRVSDLKFIVPDNHQAFINYVDRLKNHPDPKVIIWGDWDADGVMSSKIMFNLLLDLDIPVTVDFTSVKEHGINQETILICNTNEITHLIIVDSSTNSMEEFNQLPNIDILVVDHHTPSYTYKDYPKNVAIINSRFKENEFISEYSAGYLAYTLATIYRVVKNMKPRASDMVYGYITLISDGSKLSNPFIKDIILNSPAYTTIPPDIRVFMNEYQPVLTKSVVIYSIANKINHLCRMNDKENLRKLFFTESTYEEKSAIVAYVNAHQKETREQVNTLAEMFTTYSEDLGSCLLANLDLVTNLTSLSKDYMINSTGYIAGSISDLVGLPVIAYISDSNTTYKFSGRSNRQVFPFEGLVKTLQLTGGGHPQAYGFKAKKYQLEQIRTTCKSLESMETAQKHKVLRLKDIPPQSIDKTLYLVSRLNEISGDDMLPIYIEAPLTHVQAEQRGKMTQYIFNQFIVKDLTSSVTDTLEPVYIEPQFNKHTECFIINRI